MEDLEQRLVSNTSLYFTSIRDCKLIRYFPDKGPIRIYVGVGIFRGGVLRSAVGKDKVHLTPCQSQTSQ